VRDCAISCGYAEKEGLEDREGGGKRIEGRGRSNREEWGGEGEWVGMSQSGVCEVGQGDGTGGVERR
jgi:hypothetical protein